MTPLRPLVLEIAFAGSVEVSAGNRAGALDSVRSRIGRPISNALIHLECRSAMMSSLSSRSMQPRRFKPNEAVEKVPTTKKVYKLGVPKWYLDPRSSLKCQIRRSFFLQIFRSDFSYRFNARLSGWFSSSPLKPRVRRTAFTPRGTSNSLCRVRQQTQRSVH